MHVQAAVVGGKLAVEHAYAEILLLHDLSGLHQQILQKVEFDRGEDHFFAI